MTWGIDGMLLDLFKTTSLLLSLGLLQFLIFRAFDRSSLTARGLTGLLYGSIAILAMMMPFNFSPGVIFDPRSVIISLSGFVGGPVSAVPAMLMAAGYRLSLGGVGAVAGSMVVLVCGAGGVIYHYIERRYRITTRLWQLFAYGVAVHFFALFSMLALPAELIWPVVRNLALPFFTIYPLATVLLGAVILNIARFFELNESLTLEVERRRSAENQTANLVQVFNRAGWSMAIIDAGSGRIDTANAAFCRMHGYSEEEIRNRNLADLLVPGTPDPGRDVNTMLRNPSHQTYETTHRRSDGSTFPCAINRSMLLDASGRVTHHALFCEDITTRRETEQDLREDREKLEEMVQKRTNELQKIVTLLSDREIRMAELKKELAAAQLHPVRPDDTPPPH